MDNNQIQNKRVLISIGDASEYVGVSVDTLRRWEKKGRLEPYRSPGGHRYYEKDQLDSLFGKRYTRDEETQKHEKIEKEEEPVQAEPVEVPKIVTVHRLEPIVLEIRPTRPIDIPKLEPVRIQRREVIQEETVTLVQEEVVTPKPPPLLIPQVSLPKEVPQPVSLSQPKRNSKEIVTTIIIVVILLLVIVLGIILFIMLARSQTVLSPSP